MSPEHVRCTSTAMPTASIGWNFEDFAFYRMEVVDVYYVGGFGVMSWVSAAEYQHAMPDPLADAATRIIEHMNADHADALVLLAGVFGGTESQEATMTAVDRLGFNDGERKLVSPLEMG